MTKATPNLRLLILGGTAFLGRHLVESALQRGHQVTLFNRGNRNPFPELETIKGDRDPNIRPGLAGLKGRAFDVVIDVAGYVPRIVRASTEQLRDTVKRCVFISSISVCADNSQPGITEDAPVATMPDPTLEDINEHYGALKALCEQTVTAGFGQNALIVRPGLIVGPHDPTDRFTYWPVRAAHHAKHHTRLLAPGRPDRLVQFIDARDLSDWTIHAIEQEINGVFHVTGQPIPMREILPDAAHWIDDTVLLEQKVNPWMGADSLPLWIPENMSEMAGFMQFNVQKALDHGLKLRPTAQTLHDTLTWAQTRDPNHEWRSGITLEREQALLKHSA